MNDAIIDKRYISIIKRLKRSISYLNFRIKNDTEKLLLSCSARANWLLCKKTKPFSLFFKIPGIVAAFDYALS